MHHFACLGATVIATDPDESKLDSMITHCGHQSHTIHAYPLADFSDSEIEGLFLRVKQDFGCTVSVLINYWPSKPLPQLTGDENELIFSNRLHSITSPFFSFGRASAQQMLETDEPCLIINMLTFPYDNHSNDYDSESSIVAGFTKSWAKELAAFNIRVGGVIPGTAHRVEEDELDHWAVIQDELIRSAEYIVTNEYFNGRVMAAEM